MLPTVPVADETAVLPAIPAADATAVIPRVSAADETAVLPAIPAADETAVIPKVEDRLPPGLWREEKAPVEETREMPVVEPRPRPSWAEETPMDDLPSLTDTLLVRNVLGAAGPHGVTGLVNQYAAMPSLHAAWAFWVALVVFTTSNRRRLVGRSADPWSPSRGVRAVSWKRRRDRVATLRKRGIAMRGREFVGKGDARRRLLLRRGRCIRIRPEPAGHRAPGCAEQHKRNDGLVRLPRPLHRRVELGASRSTLDDAGRADDGPLPDEQGRAART